MLTWEPPPDVLMPSILYYIITIRNGRGDILYNKALSVSQQIFNTPNSCGQYEASVTAVCGTAIGANVQFHLKGSKSIFYKFEFRIIANVKLGMNVTLYLLDSRVESLLENRILAIHIILSLN